MNDRNKTNAVHFLVHKHIFHDESCCNLRKSAEQAMFPLIVPTYPYAPRFIQRKKLVVKIEQPSYFFHFLFNISNSPQKQSGSPQTRMHLHRHMVCC